MSELIPPVVATLALLCAGIFVFPGRERIWRWIAGDPDLGDVSLATLKRRRTKNDALICRPEQCPAPRDEDAPVYAVPPEQLRALLARVIADEPLTERVAHDDEKLIDRYIQRSRLWRFPDTINLRFHALPDGGSTLTLYSRSQLGRRDMGANLARLRRWLDKLSIEYRSLPKAKAPEQAPAAN